MVEGLARVTALLPAPEAAKAGQRLIGPFLEVAQTDIHTNPGDHLIVLIMLVMVCYASCALLLGCHITLGNCTVCQ